MEGITMGFLKKPIPQFITIDKGVKNHFDIRNIWVYTYEELFPTVSDKTIAIFKIKQKQHEKGT
jgi:hypothetical protein